MFEPEDASAAVMAPPADDVWDDPGYLATLAEPPLTEWELTSEALLDQAKRQPADTLAASLRLIDPAGLDETGRVDLAVLWHRAENAAAAARLTAIAEYAGAAPADPDDARAFAWAEVGAALGLGDGQASSLVAMARHLVSHLPATLTAMRSGDLSVDKARRISERTYALSREQCTRVEAHVLKRAARQSPAALDAAVRRAVDRLDPDGADERHRDAKQDVRLTKEHLRDGMAELCARMSSVDAEVVYAGADAWARRAKAAGDERPLEHLRVAAMVAWAEEFLTGKNAPTRHGRPITVNITVDLPTFLGLTQHPAEILPSGALIPAAALRDLLPDAELRRLIIDPMTGHLLDVGRRTYRPPARTAEFVALRDNVATTPTGSQAAAGAQDVDHMTSYGAGGRTDRANLHSPTRRWHRAKTLAGWVIHRNDDGTQTWTSPQGRTYRVEPHDYRLGP